MLRIGSMKTSSGIGADEEPEAKSSAGDGTAFHPPRKASNTAG
jgi:hypothetical protein